MLMIGLRGGAVQPLPWLDFDTEINRLKQVFANNSYPQNLTESIINDLLSKHHRGIIDTTRNQFLI